MNETEIRLTQFGRGGGCSCKIAPNILEEILSASGHEPDFPLLLVGNKSRDDAAAFKIDDKNAILSTTDFFTPIVDDPKDFGRIAAANAISDIYAMGGKPIMAIAILGWPIEKLPVNLAARILQGGRQSCSEAGIPVAGGHSIDTAEPIFGLSVTGIVPINNLKTNSTAKKDDRLFLTKPIGSGILSSAFKRGLLSNEQYADMVEQMSKLNNIGEPLGKLEGVHAMTDITGFGLMGHLIEMAEGSGLSAMINYEKVRKMNGVKELISNRVFPDATTRNWNSYSKLVKFEKSVNVMEAFTLLPDPQTNGGMLISVSQDAMPEVKKLLIKFGLDEHLEPIGSMIEKAEKIIYVE
jgi:selenide,water dikinase